MALGATALAATRDQALTTPMGSGPPIIPRDQVASSSTRPVDVTYANALAASKIVTHSQDYINDNIEIAKAYVISPTNQGQRGGVAARMSMMYDPLNSPSRSQKMQGYTNPVQVFASTNPWTGAEGGQVKSGKRQKQPSTKTVSPFSNLPIPTRMPWDL